MNRGRSTMSRREFCDSLGEEVKAKLKKNEER